MTRAVRKSPRRQEGSGKAPAPQALDPRAVEAIELFVRLLAQCGCEPGAVVEQVRQACEQIPRRWVRQARAAPREISEATHVLTVWFSDPAYLDPVGLPRALPLRGSARSLETLIAGIDPTLDISEVLAYLLKSRALRRLGARYVPRGRALSLRGVRGPNEYRNLRGLLAMLRTLEHNGRPRRQAPSWFEFSAENPRIPKRACAKYDEFVSIRAMRFLCDADAELRRLELTAKPGEPTVRLGTGVYRYEEDLSGSQGRETGRKRKGARRARKRQ